MLVVVQFAYSDQRRFVPDFAGRIGVPLWSEAGATGFVRGFGAVEDRFTKLRDPIMRASYKKEQVERTYVQARSRVRVVVAPDPKQPAVHISHIYTRLIHDGNLSSRVEFGFEVGGLPKEPIRRDVVLGVMTRILDSTLIVRDRARSELAVKDTTPKLYVEHAMGPLGGADIALRDRIVERTTLSTHPSVKDAREGKARGPVQQLIGVGLNIFIDGGATPLDPEMEAISAVHFDAPTDYSLIFFEEVIGQRPFGLWLICGYPADKADQARRIKLHILRLAAELRAMEKALQSYSQGNLRRDMGEAERSVFEASIRRSMDRLGETSRSLRGDMEALVIGEEVNLRAMGDVVANIDRRLAENFGAGLRSARSQIEIVASGSGRMPVIYAQSVEYIAGDKQVGDRAGGDINKNISGNAGNIGRGNTIQGSTINQTTSNAVDKMTPDDLAALAAELEKVAKEANAASVSDAEVDQASAVKKAANAAKGGDKKGLLDHLAALGPWTLGIAEKVGVPIATGLLKGMFGIP